MKNRLVKVLAFALMLTAMGTTTSCDNGNKTVYDNEKDTLIFATTELDGVFNPFYYSVLKAITGSLLEAVFDGNKPATNVRTMLIITRIIAGIGSRTA